MNTNDQTSVGPERGVFANRTLNLRSVKAIGYDMDYTLLHYKVDEWEGAAFRHAKGRLAADGWPIDELQYTGSAFTLGLVFDKVLGNLLKATRFGYVVRAQHGMEMLPYEKQREAYAETVVDLSEDRFEFMNTMFELSRASLWCQLVDTLDRGELPSVRSYYDLYDAVDDALNGSHIAGALKAEIIADPDRFLDPDSEIVQTLLDQRAVGKQVLLITNSDWSYTRDIMAYAVDPHCPKNSTWRDLFDIVIVAANKPRFFSGSDQLFRIINEDESLMLPHWGPLDSGHVYFGGNARLVEEALRLHSGQVLYVGDHLFGDVHVTKDILRWRTALIAWELEAEIQDAGDFAECQRTLEGLMSEKVAVDRHQAQLRMARERATSKDVQISAELEENILRSTKLDEQIAPLAKAASKLGNEKWGSLMRAGNDKSLFAREVEKYADVYTSRVSNLWYETPFGYLRADRGSLPHDRAL